MVISSFQVAVTLWLVSGQLQAPTFGVIFLEDWKCFDSKSDRMVYGKFFFTNQVNSSSKLQKPTHIALKRNPWKYIMSYSNLENSLNNNIYYN